MKLNKINFLIISLFLNNIKSVKLVSQRNGGAYKYEDRQQISIPQKLQNETDLEYNMREYEDLSLIPSKLLPLFILEIKQINSGDTFDIQNNFNQIAQYQVINANNLISIKKINNTNTINVPININTNPTTNTNPDINYTVLALSYMDKIKSFLLKNSAIHSNYPNIYIYNDYCLVINTIDSSYYIFEQNYINRMKNRPEISHLFEVEKTITCYDKCKNFSRDWMPTIAVIAAIVVPLAGKKVKQE